MERNPQCSVFYDSAIFDVTGQLCLAQSQPKAGVNVIYFFEMFLVLQEWKCRDAIFDAISVVWHSKIRYSWNFTQNR